MSTKKRLKLFRWKKWAKDTLLFSSPVLIPVLTSLQGIAQEGIKTGNFLPNQLQLMFLLGSAYSSFVAAFLGFIVELRKEKK
jgi:hypothetical protein